MAAKKETTPKNITLDAPMGLIKFSGYGAEYILPWDAAVQIMTLMRDATPVEGFYDSGVSGYRIAKRTTLEFKAFMPEEQAALLMAGVES